MLTNIVLGVFGVFNLYTFVLMGWDKSLAGKDRRRVPERRFYRLAMYGGSLGILLAMPAWRHKTKKWSFKRTIYTISAAQFLLLIVLWQFIGAYL